MSDELDLDGRPAPPVAAGGAAIAPVGLHAGVVTNMEDDAAARAFFAANGVPARSIGAPGLGRRIYLGPFATEGALDGGARAGARGRVRLALPGRLLMRRLALGAAGRGRGGLRRGAAPAPRPGGLRGAVPALRHGGAALSGDAVRRGRGRGAPGPLSRPSGGAAAARLPDELGRPRRAAGAGRAAGAVPDRRQRAGDPAGAGASRDRHGHRRRGVRHPVLPRLRLSLARDRRRGAGAADSTSGRSRRRARSTRRWRWRARPGSSRPTRRSTRGSETGRERQMRGDVGAQECRGRCPVSAEVTTISGKAAGWRARPRRWRGRSRRGRRRRACRPWSAPPGR